MTVAVAKRKGTNAVVGRRGGQEGGRGIPAGGAARGRPSAGDARLRPHRQREGQRAGRGAAGGHRDRRRAAGLQSGLARGADHRAGRADHLQHHAADQPAAGLHDQPRDAVCADPVAGAGGG